MTPTEILREYSEIPATPFLVNPRLQFLRNFLDKRKISYIKDKYSLVVTIPGFSDQKLVLMSHLDHPGIVVKNQHYGVALGTLYQEVLAETIKKSGPINLDIFSPEGRLITTKGKLIRFYGNGQQKVKLDIPVSIPINSHATYHLPKFSQSENSLYLYAADNDVPTATLLSLLCNLKTKPCFTIKVVFTFFEEVHQVSSFYLASNNILMLNPSDFVLNLECKKVENHPSNLNIYNLDYLAGPVLQFSEKGCRYGYHFKVVNRLEQLTSYVAKKNGLPLQVGAGFGSCDARPFSNFPITPHICTLNVPNRDKHNVNEQGNVVPETILNKDLNTFESILIRLVELKNDDVIKALKSNPETVSSKFTKPDTLTDHQFMKRKISLNYRLMLSFHQVIATGEYFPTNLVGMLTNYFYKFLFYLSFIRQMLASYFQSSFYSRIN